MLQFYFFAIFFWLQFKTLFGSSGGGSTTQNPCSYRIVNVTSKCPADHLMKNIVAAEIHFEKKGACSKKDELVSMELFTGSNLASIGQLMATTKEVLFLSSIRIRQ